MQKEKQIQILSLCSLVNFQFPSMPMEHFSNVDDVQIG